MFTALHQIVDRITKLSAESAFFADMFRPADALPPLDRATELIDRQAVHGRVIHEIPRLEMDLHAAIIARRFTY